MSRSGAGRPRPTSHRNQRVAGQERSRKLRRKTLVARELAEPCRSLLVLVSEVALVRGELVGRQDTLLSQKRLPSREHRLPPHRPEQIKLGARSFLVSHTSRLHVAPRVCIRELPDLTSFDYGARTCVR
jgi:hypothetical protein